MDEKVAREVIDLAKSTYESMNKALIAIQTNCSESEFDRYRTAIAGILGHVLTDVLRPIYEEHVHLAPADMRPFLRTR